jgi:hypothetical protein
MIRDETLMTMRVSRDSGRTWGPTLAVRASDQVGDFNGAYYPPCECPRCLPEREAELRAVRRR